MSEVKVNSIKGLSANVAAISINNADGTCTANITSNGGGQLSNRNMIVNGGMMINQRYEDAAETPSDGEYTMDRWQSWLSTGSKFSITRSDDHPDDFNKSLLVTSLSAATVDANHEHGITTKIEGQDMAQLAFGTPSAKSVTLSFFVKCSLTGTFGGLVANAALNMSYVFSYTINSANTWERKTITIPPTTSGTFSSGNANGLQVHFEFGVGSNRTAAVGWQTNTAVRGVSNQVNLVATNAATWRMTGLQLEVGTTATDFEHRSYADELLKCQRYYENVKGASFNNSQEVLVANGFNYTSNRVIGNFQFKVEKRARPSITTDDASEIQVLKQNAAWYSAGAFGGNSNKYCTRLDCTSISTSPLTEGFATEIRLTSDGIIHFAAEL